MEKEIKQDAVSTPAPQENKNSVVKLENVIQLTNTTMTEKELLFLLKQTFPTLSTNDYLYALSQCKSYGLDPRKKEIYFVPFASKTGNSIASITSYEVYARELENANYDFVCEWKGDDDLSHPENLCVRAKVLYKANGAIRYQTPWISIKEYAKMDYNKTNLVGMWKQFPTLMLEKCVLVRCSRMVLGKNLGYTAEELWNANQYGINGNTAIPEKTYTEEQKQNTYAISKWYYKERGLFFTRKTAKECWAKFVEEFNKFVAWKKLNLNNVYELGCSKELEEQFKDAWYTQYGMWKCEDFVFENLEEKEIDKEKEKVENDKNR